MGIQIFYILPVPEYEFHIPRAMYESLKNNKEFTFYNYSGYLDKNKNEIEAVSRLSEEFGIKILQTPEIFCNPVCEVSDSSGLFYFDSNHLTMHGSKKMIPLFQEIVGYP